METIESLYFGDLAHKIENAHRLHREVGARLEANPEIQAQLDRLRRLREEVAEAMRCMGLVELCRECGGRTGGGCCSAAMADETDALLLLINLSAGFEAAPKRDDDFECCFLGPEGCSLTFKPFLCLNYLCRQIQSGSSPEQLARLQGATSALLGQILVVEELIRVQLSADATADAQHRRAKPTRDAVRALSRRPPGPGDSWR
jgi:hypothetical protein